MTSKEIRMELYRIKLDTGFTMAALAREMGVKPVTVYRVIDRGSPSRRIQKRIAQLLHRPLTDVWPELKEKKPKLAPA